MKNSLNLTWKDVFNSQNIWPADFIECRIRAKEQGYKYLGFNGYVFHVDDSRMENSICTELDL